MLEARFFLLPEEGSGLRMNDCENGGIYMSTVGCAMLADLKSMLQYAKRRICRKTNLNNTTDVISIVLRFMLQH